MILSLSLARLGDGMERASVHRVCAAVGDALKPGSPIAEFRVDLASASSQDCPPVFHFRLVSTERATLRSLTFAKGDVLAVGSPLALLSSLADEPLDAAPARPLRTT
ncbi:MAG: hypothetical protein JST92_08625, partial [Deltaproteobacteria bacterium]|nr:hypothetical protein [Deltaproteobacteria bacterium]